MYILADEPTGALDTKTSTEIIEVFKILNSMGKTVIVITHDMEIANQTKRIVEIGESTSRYQVFTIASCNLHKELWEDTDNTAVYFEFTDNEYYNYVRRIKVLN